MAFQLTGLIASETVYKCELDLIVSSSVAVFGLKCNL
jgi:hypothetical protein